METELLRFPPRSSSAVRKKRKKASPLEQVKITSGEDENETIGRRTGSMKRQTRVIVDNSDKQDEVVTMTNTPATVVAEPKANLGGGVRRRNSTGTRYDP